MPLGRVRTSHVHTRQLLADQITPGNEVTLAPVMTYTNRMSWATQVLETLRAFLAPLYAFLKGQGAHKPGGKHKYRTPLAIVLFCVRYIQIQLRRTSSPTTDLRKRLPGTGATDAGATATHAGIGGWHGTDATNQWNVDWFMVEVTPYTHPWAFERDNNTQRLIAALELFVDIYCTDCIAQKYSSCRDTHYATATTDNQGNTYITTKHYTPAFSNAYLAM